MSEYKYSEDCFPKKEKFDELIDQVSDKTEYDSIQNLNLFIEQIHNYNQFSAENLLNAFKNARDYIQYFPKREKDTLIQYIGNTYLCADIIAYFLNKCQSEESAQTIPEQYFDLAITISKETSFFSDFEDYYLFVFHLVDNYDYFPDRIKNLINTIIIFIIMPCKNPVFLSNLYFSPQHGKLLKIAIDPKINDTFSVKVSAQNVIKNLYLSLNKFTEDIETAANILSNFFEIHKQNDYYGQETFNDEFIIHISIAIIYKFPETYKIICSNHAPFFQKLFNYFRVDNNLSFFAFHLVTLIIQNFTREDPPDLDFFLEDEWDHIINFLVQREKYNSIISNFKKMLLFSATYLRFGSAFFDKFSRHGFFDKLLILLHQNKLTFAESAIAVKCLSNAIIFSGSPTQIYYLFSIGVLPVLLTVLENDSDEELTHEILYAIQIIYEVCQNAIEMQIEQIPATAVDIFTTCFAEESGYEILAGLKTCADEARHLSELIDDPPNSEI